MTKNTKKTAQDHNKPSVFDRNVKDSLVLACLKHAVFDGFSAESLKMACKCCNIDYANAIGMFPNPEKDIPNHWWIMLDDVSQEQANTLKKDMRIRDKISTLVKGRITELNKHKVCAKKMFAKYTLPHNSSSGMHQLWDSANIMWLGIGDNTPTNDRNYYTKRLILSAVLGSSIYYWLQDEDGDIDNYIDRRIDDALKLGKVKNLESLKNFTEFLPFMNHPLKMR